MYQDKTLTCRDCSQEFIFTAGEQEFYAEKGFDNEPTRCKDCRSTRKAGRPRRGPGGGGGNGRGDRQMFSVVCDDCGNETEVPFRPSQDRPVYCKDCFGRRKG